MQGGQPVVTFVAEGRLDDVVEQLVVGGFVLESPLEVRTTVLDTFDGRLHRAGLRLRAEHGSRIDLVLAADGCDLARTGIDAVPRTAQELPPGDPWTRAAKALGIRALQPQLVVRWTRRSAYRRNSNGDLVAVAELLDDLAVDGCRPVRPRTSTVELRAVGRSGKPARRTVEALTALGLVPLGHDTVDLCATAADVDLSGFAPSTCGPLEAGMPAIDGIRAVLAPLAASIAAQWDGTIDRVDTEFLHQLRVAIRRTRTILSAADPLLPPDVRRRVTADVAWLASLTSTPRDLDVCLVNWSSDTTDVDADTMQALEPIRAALEQRRNEHYDVLATAMRSRRARLFRSDWSGWLADPGIDDTPEPDERTLGPFVAQLVRRMHRQLVRDGRGIDECSPAADLHELRKDAKRLRYVVDGFASILPEQEAARLVSSLKALQEVLGRHQDADVHGAILASTAPRLVEHGAPPATMIALGRMLERQDERRRRARAEFPVVFARFDRPKNRRAVDAIGEALG